MELRECRESIEADEPRGCCRCDSASSAGSRCPRTHGCTKPRRRSGDAGGGETEKKERSNSCYDKFALAKRLHAENLQHQPLPDKVNDHRVFKNVTIAAHEHRACSASCDRAKYRANVLTKFDRFAPALGCKEPKTRMDLAICWETPVDPVYEPRRSTHIDGSEGGSGPAIFALIQHAPAPRNRELLVQEEGDHRGGGGCGCADGKAKREEASSGDRCCCECLCDRIESIAVAVARPSRDGTPAARANSVPRITERRCAACESAAAAAAAAAAKRERDPRLIRSAVGIALGVEGKRNDVLRRNGLPPAKGTVPRPRTPFARRAFCIDTLTPPFSVVHGCRDADYPEHWRLMSVYQQSYRNPQRRRTRHF